MRIPALQFSNKKSTFTVKRTHPSAQKTIKTSADQRLNVSFQFFGIYTVTYRMPNKSYRFLTHIHHLK